MAATKQWNRSPDAGAGLETKRAPASDPSTVPGRAGDLPATLTLGRQVVTFRRLAPGDASAVLAFGQRQAPDDLLFLERDITDATEIGGWIDEERRGDVTTVLAVSDGGRILGYSSLLRRRLRWMRHVGEIRLLVDAGARGQGLGRILLAIAFESALAADHRKLLARMTLEEASARALFEALGFQTEAVLRGHVLDARGRRRDLLQLSLDLDAAVQPRCDGCGDPAPSRLALAGHNLCWACYDFRYAEYGRG